MDPAGSMDPKDPMDRSTLAAAHCRPLDADARLAGAKLAERLRVLPQWQSQADAIVRRYAFDDYHRTMAFVNAVAQIAHAEDHHPEMTVAYDRCTVLYSTHSAGGVTDNDLICAAKVDAVYARLEPARAGE